MKLLFDENLAPSLAGALADVFPASAHLRDVGLRGADDEIIWEYAAANGLAIVTKDDDFRGYAVLRGPPPKLIVLTMGNCPTRAVEEALRENRDRLLAFQNESLSAVIELP